MATATAPAAVTTGTTLDAMASEMSTAATLPAANVAPSANGPPEEPSGMAEEEALLAAFSEVPTISRVVVRAAAVAGPGAGSGDGIILTV